MNSENPILAAVIAATSAIIVGFMNWHSSRKDTGMPSQNVIYLSALNDVWEPLDRLFTLHLASDPQNALHQIDTIVSANYKLIPPEFIREYQVLKHIDKPKNDDFTKARIISASYFNWIRKYFGYPYDGRKITTRFTPTSKRDIILATLKYGALFLITSVVALILLFSLMLLQTNDRLSFTDYLAIASALLGIVVTWHITLNHPQK